MKEIDKRYDGLSEESGLRYGIIEVTRLCQNRCPGCYMVRRDDLDTRQMTLEQAVRVLDLCRDYLGKELETMDILGGEPTSWPFLKDYIEELLRRGILPWIFTNMLPITEELARWFFERKVHITGKLNIGNFSDPAQVAIQANMIGSSTKAAMLMEEKIDLLLKVGYKDPLLKLENLLRMENISFAPEYYRFCLEKGIGADMEMLACGDKKIDWSITPSREMVAQMIKDVQAVRKDFGLSDAEVLMPHIFGSCAFYNKGLYFAVDGHIRACSNSTYRLAYVDDPEPIKMAYESQLISCRLKLSKDIIGEPCKSCCKWDKCRGGCRATAENIGNPFSGYTLCPVPYLSGPKQ